MPTLVLDHLRRRRMRRLRVGITQLIWLSRNHPRGEKEKHLPSTGAAFSGVPVAAQFAGNTVVRSSTRDGYADPVRADPLLHRGILTVGGITARSA